MEIFELIVDEKVAVWRRSHIKIEAESYEEAVKDCIESGIGNAYDVIDSEYLYETEEYLQPSFEHPMTVEVMDTKYHTLGTDEGNRQFQPNT